MTRRNGKTVSLTYRELRLTFPRSGPAKDYLRSLQDRLQETETLLIGALNQLGDDELLRAFQQDKSVSHQTWASSTSGQDYWARYPLNRLESVRAWQESRLSERATSRPLDQVHLERTSEPKGQRPPQDTKSQLAAPSSGIIDFPMNGEQPHSSASQNTVYDWPQTQSNANVPSEERYSEETRDVAQTLFSISNQRNAFSRDEQPRSIPQQMDDEVAVSPDLADAPSRFPRHLFW